MLLAHVGLGWSQFESVFASFISFIYFIFLFITEIVFHSLIIKIQISVYKFNMILVYFSSKYIKMQ